VPAAAGIPITHRGVSSQVTIVAGHDAEALDLACLARAPGTLVVFMGLASLGALADGLVRHGKRPSTPAAVVARGTTSEQQTVIAPLAHIADAAEGLEAPALVIVGEVVELAGRLAAHELLPSAAVA
jgi:uroporphyrin-III C-methyltransferase / precorrin-2 dehydrogenase / sirohydrochlorin ferrochelatase